MAVSGVGTRVLAQAAPAAQGGEAPAAPAPTGYERPANWAPYKPGVGAYLGIGGAALGAGVIGAGAGALAEVVLAGMDGGGLNGALGASGKFGGIAGGVIGLAAGGLACYFLLSSNHDKKQDAKFGRPIDSYATQLLRPFDHSGNGQIDLDNPTGLPGNDERLRVETRTERGSELHYDWWDNDVDVDHTTQSFSRNVAATQLWNAANTNGDQVVTSKELSAVLARFDADHSGSLTVAERQAFNAAFPPQTDQWR